MSVNREQGLFLGVLALAGGMSYMWFSDAFVKQPMPRPKEQKLPPTPPAADLLFPKDGDPRFDVAKRDFFAQPKDWNPLPPLTLELPPRPEIAAVGPLFTPTPAPEFLSALRIEPTLQFKPVAITTGDDAVPAESPDGADADGANSEGASGAATASGATATSDKAAADAAEAARQKQFDWILMQGERRSFGRILNADKFKLLDDETLAIDFESIDPKSGKVFARNKVNRDQVNGPHGVGYGFADTAANRSQLREINAIKAKASAADCLDAARDCLAWRADDPVNVLAAADRLIDRAIAMDRGSVDAWNLKAQVREYAHDTEGELAAIEAARAAGIDEPRLRARHARLLRNLGLLASAEALLESESKANLVDPSSLRELGRVRLARGNAKGALEAFDTALRVGTVTPDLRQQLRVDSATAALHSGDLSAAYAYADQAVKATPPLAAAHVARGAVLWLQGKREAAIGDFKEALVVDTSARDAVFDLALATGLSGDLATAQSRLEEAQNLDPLRGFDVEISRGIFAELAGDLEDAADHYEAALEMHPDHPYGLYRSGRLKRRTENQDGAADDLARALLDLGEMNDVLNELGYVALLSDNFEEALKFFEESLRREPKQTAVRVLYGVALARSNRIPDARVEFETAAAGTDDPVALAGVAYCAYREGDADLAVDRFAAAKASASDPNSEVGKYAATNQERIDIHRSKSQWVDEFERDQIKNDWTVVDAFGPAVEIVRGVTTFNGTQRPGNSDERTELRRDAEGKTFVLFEAQMRCGATNAAAYGVRVSYDKNAGRSGSSANIQEKVPFAEIAVAVFPAERAVKLHVISEGFNKVLHDWVKIHDLPADSKVTDTHTLTIERTNADTGEFVVRVDDKTLKVNDKAGIIVSGLKKVSTTLSVASFAVGKARDNMAVEVDTVRVVRFGVN